MRYQGYYNKGTALFYPVLSLLTTLLWWSLGSNSSRCCRHFCFLVSGLEQRTNEKVQQKEALPHILMIIMDDLGSHDLGIHGSGILTPTADNLIRHGGIYLNNYYVLPFCSPTRAALLSGRYPLHTGLHKIITDTSTDGLPLDEETLPTVLRKSHYQAHAVGKWHVGHSKWEMTPTFRGFQSFFGYYLGWTDYFSHYKHDDELKLDAYDFRNDATEFCGAACSQPVDERGNYSTHVYTREAIRIIQEHSEKYNNNHDTTRPLFLYLAHQAVHWPDQVPQEYLDLYKNQSNWSDVRKIYAGMLTAADESIAKVIQALKDVGMWNNTLVVFTTDNGGPTDICGIQGSYNGKRKGGKCTIWEGGTTGDGFMSGPALQRILSKQKQPKPNEDDGTSIKRYPHIFHVVDWLPTLAAIAGATPAGKKLDGVNHLDALKYFVSNERKDDDIPPREEVFVGYADYENRWYGPAIRFQNWKLIQGSSGGPLSEYDIPYGPSQPAPGGADNQTYMLFDLDNDPEESKDLASELPIVVQVLQAKLKEYQKTYVPPLAHNFNCDPYHGLINTTTFGPTWAPWCSQIVVYT